MACGLVALQIGGDKPLLWYPDELACLFPVPSDHRPLTGGGGGLWLGGTGGGLWPRCCEKLPITQQRLWPAALHGARDRVWRT